MLSELSLVTSYGDTISNSSSDSGPASAASAYAPSPLPKHRLAAVAPLCDVVRHAGNHDAVETGHGEDVGACVTQSIRYCVPVIPK